MARIGLDKGRRLWGMLKERVDRRSLTRWGGYGLYAVVLAAVLLYLQFPTDKIKDRIEAEFEARVPAYLAIEKAHIVFGPALSLEGVAVRGTGQAASHTYLEADRIVLRPTWRTLLGRALKVDYDMSVDGGSARGRVKVPRGGGGAVELTATLQGISLTRTEPLKELSGVELSGLMSGTLEAKLVDNLARSSGKLRLEVSGGRFQGVRLDFLPAGAIKFKKLDLDCDLAGGKLTMRRADIAPGDISNKLTGVVELADHLQESKLDLRGTFGVADYLSKTSDLKGPALKATGGISYVITGTLGAPHLSLDLSGKAGAGG